MLKINSQINKFIERKKCKRKKNASDIVLLKVRRTGVQKTNQCKQHRPSAETSSALLSSLFFLCSVGQLSTCPPDILTMNDSLPLPPAANNTETRCNVIKSQDRRQIGYILEKEKVNMCYYLE